MDGMTYFGRGFITEQDSAAADRRAIRTALLLTAAMAVAGTAAILALRSLGLDMPGAVDVGTLWAGA